MSRRRPKHELAVTLNHGTRGTHHQVGGQGTRVHKSRGDLVTGGVVPERALKGHLRGGHVDGAVGHAARANAGGRGAGGRRGGVRGRVDGEEGEGVSAEKVDQARHAVVRSQGTQRGGLRGGVRGRGKGQCGRRGLRRLGRRRETRRDLRVVWRTGSVSIGSGDWWRERTAGGGGRGG